MSTEDPDAPFTPPAPKPPEVGICDAPALPPSLAGDYARWCKKKADEKARREAAERDGNAFDKAKEELKKTLAALPDKVTVPFHLTPEGQRLDRFRNVCPAEFQPKVNRVLLKNPPAFDKVAGWNGEFPGPLASGPTGCGKTRAGWSAVGRLWVRENRAFAWFPVKRLITEFERFEGKDLADEFWRFYRGNFRLLLVDDADKINWSFDSQHATLFQFYDWIYANHVPCITTTNKDRAWWTARMGEPFVRRLFDEAHFHVEF